MNGKELPTRIYHPAATSYKSTDRSLPLRTLYLAFLVTNIGRTSLQEPPNIGPSPQYVPLLPFARASHSKWLNLYADCLLTSGKVFLLIVPPLAFLISALPCRKRCLN